MPNDPFYHTREWRDIREIVLKRDNHRCTVAGCTSTNRLTVDHIVSRRKGGTNHPSNLRTLCQTHDNAVKEQNGKRKNGHLRAKGCDAKGEPIDPTHPWRSGT